MSDCGDNCQISAATAANHQNNCVTEQITTETEGAVTKTTTRSCSKNNAETVTNSPGNNTLTASCPCGHFDLDKLAAESRRCAFKSSNIALALSNSIIIFTMIVLQEILKQECHTKRLNLDTVFLITSAIAALGDGLQINNPPPFNS